MTMPLQSFVTSFTPSLSRTWCGRFSKVCLILFLQISAYWLYFFIVERMFIVLNWYLHYCFFLSEIFYIKVCGKLVESRKIFLLNILLLQCLLRHFTVVILWFCCWFWFHVMFICLVVSVFAGTSFLACKKLSDTYTSTCVIYFNKTIQWTVKYITLYIWMWLEDS
jgi:hypothetical protein